MPGRTFSATSAYRYGFNGKEQDSAINGNGVDYDYGFRIYDARVGKFLSVDPLSNQYSYYTPYQYAGNKPIKFIDRDGLEEDDDDEAGKNEDAAKIAEIVKANNEKENEDELKKANEELTRNPKLRDLVESAKMAVNAVKDAMLRYGNGAIARMQASFGVVNNGGIVPQTEIVDETGKIIQTDGDQSPAWLVHQSKVADELEKNNPGAQFGRQVTLDVYNKNGSVATIITDVLFAPKNNSIFNIVDAKESEKNDLVNASDRKIFNACTTDQKMAYTWITSGQVSQVIPRGANAQAMGLILYQPIRVSPLIQIAVNIPLNTGAYANPGGISYRNFQEQQPPPAVKNK